MHVSFICVCQEKKSQDVEGRLGATGDGGLRQKCTVPRMGLKSPLPLNLMNWWLIAGNGRRGRRESYGIQSTPMIPKGCPTFRPT